MKCVKCETQLKSTSIGYNSFTGTCNHHVGQYIQFYFCPNEQCDRFLLYCSHIMTEK
jgi:hypothetical protein